MIHDSQFDYYATKLATCSSDRTIKIFDVAGDSQLHNTATLTGHEGPVWQVAWAHPKFGVLLASCSYDGSVIIHRESPQNSWSKVLEERFTPDSSVNSIAWAPHDFGLILACASSNGKIYILEHKVDGQSAGWVTTSFENDRLGCNAVSWAPFGALDPKNADGAAPPVLRLVTGSCDNKVRIWRREEQGWVEEVLQSDTPHLDWVRDVAWAPNTAMPYNIIASCSEDKSVYIWKQRERDQQWEATLMKKDFEAPVWRVSWSVTGNVLAVSTGDHKVTLWKQSVDESFVQISTVEEE